VGPGAANTQGLTVVNGAGLTAVPGYIDGHKHMNNSLLPEDYCQLELVSTSSG